MKDSRIFSEIEKIRKTRSVSHGEAKANFDMIASLWSAYLKVEINSQDVGFMMAMLKAARFRGGDKLNIDNFIDGANYIALAGDLL